MRETKATKAVEDDMCSFFASQNFEQVDLYQLYRSVGIYNDVIRPHQITSFFVWNFPDFRSFFGGQQQMIHNSLGQFSSHISWGSLVFATPLGWLNGHQGDQVVSFQSFHESTGRNSKVG